LLLNDDDFVQEKNIKDNLSKLSTQIKVLASPDEVNTLEMFIPEGT
jgi:hypothetical protein